MVCLYLEKPVTRKVKLAYTLCNFGQINENVLVQICKYDYTGKLRSTKIKCLLCLIDMAKCSKI